MRPTYSEINLKNLEYNLKQIQAITKGKKSIMAIVKANAYGHGADIISLKLANLGVKCFGVATVKEALILRERGLKENIVVLSSFFTNDIDNIIKENLTLVCYRLDQLDFLNTIAKENNLTINIHLKFDTGMSRLGFLEEEIYPVLTKIKQYKNLKIEGIMSHLSSAEENCSFNKVQINKFNNIVNFFQFNDVYPTYTHIENSSATIKKLAPWTNMVRIGIALYGCYTDIKLKKLINLKQILSLKSKIIQIKKVKKGSFISYNRKFETKKDTTIAIIPIGYADGYNHKLSNIGKVLINGKLARILGNVCMDMIVVDVSHIKNANIESTVDLISPNHPYLTINYISKKINVIPYELMCSISERVIRQYIE